MDPCEEALKTLNDHVTKLEEELDRKMSRDLIADRTWYTHLNDNGQYKNIQMDRELSQHPLFDRHLALWGIALTEVASLIGMMWCCHQNFWSVLGMAFFTGTGLFGLWAWEKVEERS